jgi:predicted acylesterase/phospholipase RssA
MDDDRVLLALGGGAARGLAHIGVLRGLEEDGIEVIGIAGTSMGSIVGALAASGVDANEIEGVFRGVDWTTLGRIMLGSMVGEAFHDLLRETLGKGSIENLRIPFAAVCCDIDTGEEVVLREGSIADAVRASAAIPGFLAPFRIGTRTLVDGVGVEPVPVTAALGLVEAPVVPVNVLRPPEPGQPTTFIHSPPKAPGMRSAVLTRVDRWLSRRADGGGAADADLPGRREVVMRSFLIMQYHLAASMCEPVQMIEPDVGRFGWFDFAKVRGIVDEGYHAYRRWREGA